jgi:large subunit ribosomal protein L30
MAKKEKQNSVTLRKSLNRRRESHKACVRGLGLRRIGQTVKVNDTTENRGMIRRVSYLLAVEEA